MATRPRKTKPAKASRKSSPFTMRIPDDIRLRLDEVAAERGISTASLLLSETMKNIGPGKTPV